MPYSNIRLTETSYAESLVVTQPVDSLDMDINGQILNITEQVSIDASGTFRFYDWDAATADMGNGQIVVGTDLTLAGFSGQQLEITNLDFVANGGTATYCTVTNSQNTGSPDIDATSETNVDGTGNSGWDFGIVAEIIHIARTAYGIFKSKLFSSLLYNR